MSKNIKQNRQKKTKNEIKSILEIEFKKEIKHIEKEEDRKKPRKYIFKKEEMKFKNRIKTMNMKKGGKHEK